jgi:hypothetical protein
MRQDGDSDAQRRWQGCAKALAHTAKIASNIA